MQPKKTTIAVLGTAVLAGLLLMLWPWGPAANLRPGGSPADLQNVLLISIDTCRADHIGCYGHPGGITPNIDAVAREGVLFKNVYTPVPQTLPAHASMLTGTTPPYHGVHLNGGYCGPENVFLAEVLKSHGFATGAIISSIVLEARVGTAQGFDTYDDRFKRPGPERPAGEVASVAAKWLAEHCNDRSFLFLHFFDPHAPYEPPEPFASRWPDNPYAGEIAYTDHCIGQVIARLKELGLYESTLIIITGDHGEMLGEHGEEEHGYFVYESALKVPLMFRIPGGKGTLEIDDPVGLIDLVPTVCALLGIDPPPGVQGEDLSRHFQGSESPPSQPRFLYCESITATAYEANSLLGVVTDGWKYIQTTRPELYDLAEDPGELKNLVEKEPDQANILQQHLVRMMETYPRKGAADSHRGMDEATRRRLESLGYVGGADPKEAFRFDQSKADPKDRIRVHNMTMEAVRMEAHGRLDEAEVLCQELLREEAGRLRGHLTLGSIAEKRRDWAAFGAHMARALEIDPTCVDAKLNLARWLRRQGKLDEAIVHYHQVLQTQPDSVDAHGNLAIALQIQGKHDDALEHFREAQRLNPDRVVVLNWLAFALATHPGDARSPEEAVGFARRACELTGYRDLQSLEALADAQAAAGRFDEAARTTSRELALVEAAGPQGKKLADRIRKRLASFGAGKSVESAFGRMLRARRSRSEND